MHVGVGEAFDDAVDDGGPQAGPVGASDHLADHDVLDRRIPSGLDDRVGDVGSTEHGERRPQLYLDAVDSLNLGDREIDVAVSEVVQRLRGLRRYLSERRAGS